jgi:hypothetical protein
MRSIVYLKEATASLAADVVVAAIGRRVPYSNQILASPLD